jgi:hypothetical protein
MMRMNNEYGRVRKKFVMAYFKLSFRHLFGETEKYHEIIS